MQAERRFIHTMKFTCSKSELLKGVSTVAKAVPTKTTITILECILIDASGDDIKLTANNTELGIETVIEGSIEESGIVAIDAKILTEMVRKLPDSDVTVKTDISFKTVIECGNARFDIIGKSGEDFSYLPNVHRDECVEISKHTLRDVINQTIFSIAENENNKVMTGELFKINDNILTVISLDGHRISTRNITLNKSYSKNEVIIPGKTLKEVVKIIGGDMEDTVKMYFTSNHAIFEFDETVVVSRLIEGKYLDVERMLTNDYETRVIIKKRELFDSIDRSTLLVKEGDKKPIIINIMDDVMELKINSFIGSMNEKIDIEKEGKDIMIGFNPKFFIDALRVIDEEDISLYFVNSKSPCFIRDEENSYNYLILPVNFVNR